MDIAHKTFVVTGAGNGIGREVALLILDKGGSVAGVDLNAEGLAETAKLSGDSPNFSQHPLNITDREAVAALPAAVMEKHGSIDGLLNIAGIIQKFVPILDLDIEDMEKVINVNFWGVVYLIKEFLPYLVERPKAALVNVSSMGALAPVPGQSIYGASKAAINLLTQGLYAELIDTNVGVTAIFPGAIGTNIAGNSGIDMSRSPEDAASSGVKMTTPQEAAEVIVDAMEKGKFRATIGKDAMGLDKLARISPKKATEIIAKKMADAGR